MCPEGQLGWKLGGYDPPVHPFGISPTNPPSANIVELPRNIQTNNPGENNNTTLATPCKHDRCRRRPRVHIRPDFSSHSSSAAALRSFQSQLLVVTDVMETQVEWPLFAAANGILDLSSAPGSPSYVGQFCGVHHTHFRAMVYNLRAHIYCSCFFELHVRVRLVALTFRP
jgi:hypothetical protein